MSVEFVPVAKAGDVAPGSAAVVVVDGREIALFNVAGIFYALENACPHQGGPLAEGFIDGPIVTCPWHAWCFDVRTGSMTLGALSSVDAFEVQNDGSTISVSSEPRV